MQLSAVHYPLQFLSLFKVLLENTTAAIAEREIVRRVEAHTGRRTGSWEVQYAQYATPDKRPTLEILSSSENPERRVVMFGPRVLEGEEALPTQLQKLATYSPRAMRTIRGAEYDFVDFRVRVGLVFDKNNAASGVAVEIEYAPCLVADDCTALITELMERIAASLVPPPQAGQDSLATKAATTNFKFSRVEVDFKKHLQLEKPYFTLRHSMLLYRKLFADSASEK